jgi:hypothetical protein
MRNLGKLFLALCLVTVVGGAVANAQVVSVPQVEANVPFDFVVGDTKLPAGKYQIAALDGTENRVLEIRSADSRTTVLFDTEDAQTRNDQVETKTELVFDKVAGQYFLSEIWVEGTSAGSSLGKSRMEERLIKGGSRSEKHSVLAMLKRMKP